MTFEDLIEALSVAQGVALVHDDYFTAQGLDFALDWFGMAEEEIRTYLERLAEEDYET